MKLNKKHSSGWVFEVQTLKPNGYRAQCTHLGLDFVTPSLEQLCEDIQTALKNLFTEEALPHPKDVSLIFSSH